MGIHTRALIVLGAWQTTGLVALVNGLIAPHGLAAWGLAYVPALILVAGWAMALAVAVVSLFFGLLHSPPRR